MSTNKYVFVYVYFLKKAYLYKPAIGIDLQFSNKAFPVV